MAELNNSDASKGDGKVRSKKASTKIDMTPMVDLAFLLLTFFMLTTTFNKPQTMEIVMPEKPKAEDKRPEVNEQQVVSLVLAEDDRIFWFDGFGKDGVHETDYSSTGVRRILVDHTGKVKDLVVLIKPTDESRYKNVVDILDEMTISNISRFALVEATTMDKELIKSKQK